MPKGTTIVQCTAFWNIFCFEWFFGGLSSMLCECICIDRTISFFTIFVSGFLAFCCIFLAICLQKCNFNLNKRRKMHAVTPFFIFQFIFYVSFGVSGWSVVVLYMEWVPKETNKRLMTVLTAYKISLVEESFLFDSFSFLFRRLSMEAIFWKYVFVYFQNFESEATFPWAFLVLQIQELNEVNCWRDCSLNH